MGWKRRTHIRRSNILLYAVFSRQVEPGRWTKVASPSLGEEVLPFQSSSYPEKIELDCGYGGPQFSG